MSHLPTGDRIDRLELDIDLRLREVMWLAFEADGMYDLEVVVRLMRASYARGYMDALEEETVGLLCRENGYKIPTRREFG